MNKGRGQGVELLRKRKSRAPSATNYEVGYGNPPKEHRFKPGQSGNRKGRPRVQKIPGPFCASYLIAKSKSAAAARSAVQIKRKAAKLAAFPKFNSSFLQANDALRRDCRNAKPRPAKPSSIIAQVEGSGTPPTVIEFSGNCSSSEKYVVAPGAKPPAKFTVPDMWLAAIPVKKEIGPPYPVLSCGCAPTLMKASMPSPSKAMMPPAKFCGLLKKRLVMVLVLLFSTPISVRRYHRKFQDSGPATRHSRHS
jgi:hypothetical protein